MGRSSSPQAHSGSQHGIGFRGGSNGFYDGTVGAVVTA